MQEREAVGLYFERKTHPENYLLAGITSQTNTKVTLLQESLLAQCTITTTKLPA